MNKKVERFFCCLTLCIISCNICFCQNSYYSDSEIIHQYAFTTDTINFQHKLKKETNSFFLIKINSAEVSEFRKANSNKIKRQIAPEWFITSAIDSSLQNKKYIQKKIVANNTWKLSPGLQHIKDLKNNNDYTFLVRVNDSSEFMKDMLAQKASLHIISSYHSKYFTIKATPSLINILIQNREVLSLDIALNSPKEESAINDYDNSVNDINLFFSKYPSVTGNGLTASVKENLFDTTDIDFKGRYVPSSINSSSESSHATTMATLIAGGGNTFQTAKGVAPGSLLSSSDFANLLPDANSYFTQYNISVQNNSYGVGVENFYGSDAAAYDQSSIDNPSLIYVFSAGNSGNLTATDGAYKNINGFANLTGSFKQAKNIITVGSVDSFYNIPLLSSKGPAYDGRVKPELVAYGNDGSSGAAAITSGTVLAVQYAYASVHHDSLPQNALVKAVIINSADDVFNPGPDFYSGYGNVNVNNAVTDAFSNRHFSGSIVQNEVSNFPVHIPVNISNVKLTMVWNDPAAQSNTFTSLINDLDLTLENVNDHTTWQPWVLNSNADSITLLQAAIRSRDSLNNVEQITVSNPAAGDYIIHVKGYNIANASQAFYVVYRFDTANVFTFISPVANTHSTSGGNSIFRWNSSYAPTAATFEYSIDKGNTWQLISDTVDITKKYVQWNAPDTNVVAIARITINNTIYYSDTFDISAQVYPHIGFNCTDSALAYWDKQPGTSGYEIYTLGDRYLQPLKIVDDTSVILRKQDGLYIAIAPVFMNHTGLKSYAYNYTLQGVGCYISNFLADPDGNNASLKLFLGTTFSVKAVQFQKLISGSWKMISQIQPVQSVTINYSTHLSQGINYYRAIITLDDGTMITSNEAYVYYFINQDYIVVPNPASRRDGFSVLSNNVSSNKLMLFDITGRKVATILISQQNQNIPTTRFAKGMYFVMIFDEAGKRLYTTKIILD
jgi:hypothetical protein